MRLAGVATLRAGLVESSSVLEALLLLKHSVFQHVHNFKSRMRTTALEITCSAAGM